MVLDRKATVVTALKTAERSSVIPHSCLSPDTTWCQDPRKIRSRGRGRKETNNTARGWRVQTEPLPCCWVTSNLAQLSVELLAKGCLKLLAGEARLASGSFSLGIRRNGSGSGFVPDSLRCWRVASYVHAWMSEQRSPSSFMPT
uniref:Uncharacterized protein n=1 Tax=Mus spicilegus TaxID=10103 RepID=A0A8C6MT56_MUSSI